MQSMLAAFLASFFLITDRIFQSNKDSKARLKVTVEKRK
jgi:hypothetical protein